MTWLWHLLLSEWRWDLRARLVIWHWLWDQQGVAHLLNLVELALFYQALRHINGLTHFLIRLAKKKLGPPDENGWRTKINYERKDP